MPMQIRRTPTPNNPPSNLADGQLSVEMASDPPVLWAGVPTSIDASGRVKIAPPDLSDYVTSTALTTTLADFLPLSGGTLTGPLVLAGDATAALNPVSLQQLNDALSGQTIATGPTPPAAPANGDLWFDTNENQLKIWDGSNWILSTAPVSGFLPISGGVVTGFLGVNDWIATASSMTAQGMVISNAGRVASVALAGSGIEPSVFVQNSNIPLTTGMWLDATANYCFGSTSSGGVPGPAWAYFTSMGNFNSNANIGATGSITAGASLISSAGRVISTAVSNPSVTCVGGVPCGIWVDSTPNFCFGQMNSSGVPVSTWAYFSTVNANFTINAQAFKPGGGAWQDTSDGRIKTVTGKYEHGLAELLALQPVTYTFKGNDAPTTHVPSPHKAVAEAGTSYVGLVAQEVEGHLPECVTKTVAAIGTVMVDDLRNLDTGPLIFALINAVKELSARLEALEGART